MIRSTLNFSTTLFNSFVKRLKVRMKLKIYVPTKFIQLFIKNTIKKISHNKFPHKIYLIRVCFPTKYINFFDSPILAMDILRFENINCWSCSISRIWDALKQLNLPSYFRGEKLIVTKDNRPSQQNNKSSLRKCLCWSIGLAFVVAAVTIGSLIGGEKLYFKTFFSNNQRLG